MPRGPRIWSALRWTGLPLALRRIRRRGDVAILCYHDPDPDTLSHHLEALDKRYRFIALRDYVDARLTGRTTTLPARAVVVTLDDGYSGNARLAEVFARHSVRPTIFLTSGVVATDRAFWWMLLPGGEDEAESLKAVPDSDRIRALAAAGRSETDALPARTALSHAEVESLVAVADLQSHTVLHPILSMCSDERARAEIEDSKADLEREYGLDVYALAYPNGRPADFGEREAALAASAGYTCALTTVPGLNDATTDLFRLNRIFIPDDASSDEVVVRTSLLAAHIVRLVPGLRRVR